MGNFLRKTAVFLTAVILTGCAGTVPKGGEPEINTGKSDVSLQYPAFSDYNSSLPLPSDSGDISSYNVASLDSSSQSAYNNTASSVSVPVSSNSTSAPSSTADVSSNVSVASPSKSTASSSESTASSSESTASSNENTDLPDESTDLSSQSSAPLNENTASLNGESALPTANNTAKGFLFEWNTSDTWEENGKKCGTVNVTITNSSNRALNGWTVQFQVPDGFSLTSTWNGIFTAAETEITVKNADYNGSVPIGENVTFGFNYNCPTIFIPAASTTSFNGKHADNPVTQDEQTDIGTVQNTDGNKNAASDAPSADVKELLKRSPKAKQGDDWLHTDGNRIVDKNGSEVWLTGVNWFGYNTGTNTFDGLWSSGLRATVKAIADHGFNLIRVPISAELLNQWADGEYPAANYNRAYNEELNSMNSLEIFDYFLKLAEENGVKVMPDIHSAETDAQGHNAPLWYTDRISAEEYYAALEWLSDRYKDNDTIIAIDLKNEPHGKPNESSKAIWNGSKDANNWKYAAETAANRVLAKNPNLLIIIEGTEIYSKNNGDYSSQNDGDYYFNWWGGNLRGVKDYPVDLGKNQNKVVYSPHDYGPAVYEQPWFQGGFNYDSLIADCWQDNWLYISSGNIAPLLIGEWGGFMREPNLSWMVCMRRLIKEYRLNHTFWCLNANSGDTGGLLLDDFISWDTEKYSFVKEVLWQENGKFIGLDHEINLGENGSHI